MTSLPVPLEARTLYVIFSPANWRTPLVHFVHDKACVAGWLSEALSETPGPARRLACIPSFDRLIVPEMEEERWPNLVVKLADSDQAKAVVMGRFASEAQARVLTTTWKYRLLTHVFPDRSKVLYQPFVPPEVIDGRARLIRLHVLISPVTNRFLSAHGVLAREILPSRLDLGIVQDRRPFMLNFSGGSEYRRLEPEIEAELEEIALEFGKLANRAIERRFAVTPAG